MVSFADLWERNSPNPRQEGTRRGGCCQPLPRAHLGGGCTGEEVQGGTFMLAMGWRDVCTRDAAGLVKVRFLYPQRAIGPKARQTQKNNRRVVGFASDAVCAQCGWLKAH